MSKKKKDILDFFGKKLENQQFDFDGSGWGEMENLIVEDEKKNRKGFILWSAAGITLLLLSVFSVFQIFTQKGQKKLLVDNTKIQTKTILKEEITSITQEDTKTLNKKLSKAQNDLETKTNDLESKNQLNESNFETSGDDEVGKKLDVIDKDENLIKNIAPFKVSMPDTIKNRLIDVVNKNERNDFANSTLATLNSGDSEMSYGTESNKKVKNKKEEGSISDKNENSIVQTEKALIEGNVISYKINAIDSNADKLSIKETESAIKINNPDGENSNEKVTPEQSQITEVNDRSVGENDANLVNNKNVSSQEFLKTKSGDKISNSDTKIVIQDSIETISEKVKNNLNSAIVENQSKEDSILLISRLNLIGGLNYYKSFNDGLGNSLDPSIGLGFAKDLTSKLGVVSELKTNQKSNVNTSKEYISNSYSFGKKEEITTISTSKIYFTNLSIGGYYNLTNSFKLNVMFGGSKIITSKSEVEENFVSSFSDNKLSSTEYGYVNGFKNISYNVSLGGEYYFMNRWSAGLNYIFGISDITFDEYYNNSIKDKNSGLQLNIKYDLVQQKRIMNE